MVAAAELRTDVDEILPGVIADRRHLHEHPELAFQEYETAKFVAARLSSLGLEDIKTGVGGTGVTGLIRGGRGDGKVVMVRADMDALPILEENQVEYVSTNPGVMHACGHDAHTAMLLGLTRLLNDRKPEFAGTVKVLFQPAEEVPPGGAIEMIRDGALEGPHVDAVLGLHVSSETPAGQIAIRAGAGSASSDRFLITIKGRGGHAASPHEAVDPIVIGAQIVTAFQTMVSRNTDPVKSAVVSTTAFLAGEAFNVIPDTAELRGTVRTLDPEVRELMEQRLTALATNIATAFGGEAIVDYRKGYPGIVNDPAMTDLVRQAAIATVGAENTIDSPIGLGGEDFAYYTLQRPGCFFNVGTRNEDRGIVWGHHHPRFDIEEEGMAAGIATMGNAVLAYLES
ncbi:MAG TPA: amidohydrolase [Thermomicrobiales bacterium]|nr:amidohydrolase [Thermomicrobiales bacterium]